MTEIEKALKENYKSAWGIAHAEIGDEMDEISEFIANGDIEGRYTALLVFEEEYVNIAKYAYPDKKEGGPVFIKVSSLDNGTEMVFIDAGIPFDPTDPELLKVDMEKIGGHGIEIIIKYSKEVEYERRSDMNFLRLLV